MEDIDQRVLDQMEEANRMREVWGRQNEINKILGSNSLPARDNPAYRYKSHTMVSSIILNSKRRNETSADVLQDIMTLYMMQNPDYIKYWKAEELDNDMAIAYAIVGGPGCNPTQKDYEHLYHNLREAVQLMTSGREFRWSIYSCVLDHTQVRMAHQTEHDKIDAQSAVFEQLFMDMFPVDCSIKVNVKTNQPKPGGSSHA